MIGFDLDGTLLTEQKELGEYTVRILERAAEEGIEILPVTGRPLCGLPEEVRKSADFVMRSRRTEQEFWTLQVEPY